MNYREALSWLYSLQVHGIHLGLDRMRRLCEALEVSTESTPECRIIHVAGTNGKGSVCAMAAGMAVETGERTGLYTSPHLVSFRERIRLGPNPIPEEHVAEWLTTICEKIEGWEPYPTFFEITTALALAWYQKQRASWIVLETGLGGRLDATNVVTPAVSVITSIGLDHTKFLGVTLAEIAGEKAGIIKPGVPVLTTPQPPEVEEVFRRRAEEIGAPLTIISRPIEERWELALTGSHQRWNAALAFAALITAGLRPDPKDIANALRKVEWPGRFQLVSEGRIVLDGAHNPPAAERLAATWREQFGEEKATLVAGVLGDKDVPGVLRSLLPLAERVICVTVRNPRTMPATDLTRLVAELAPGLPCAAEETLPAALALAQQTPERTLVAGSLFLVGEALACLGQAEGTHEMSLQ